jgi:recombination protein RecT
MANAITKPGNAALSKDLKSLISTEGIKKRFTEVMGKKAAAFLSSIVSATTANTALANAEPMSVISAAMVAATLDLPINPSLGFAHIVPYSGVAQFQIGWKGLVQLAMRTGQYKTMNATVIFEGEIIKHDRMTGEIVFDESKRKSEKVVGYAFYFKLINGYEKTIYWTAEECRAHGKKYSKSFANGRGRWTEDFEAMALKTVVKNGLSKWGILSVDMQKAIESDQAAVGEDGEIKYPDSTKPEVEKGTINIDQLKAGNPNNPDVAPKPTAQAQEEPGATEPDELEDPKNDLEA